MGEGLAMAALMEILAPSGASAGRSNLRILRLEKLLRPIVFVVIV